MSVNILDITKSYLTPQMVEGISGFVGEHPSYVRSAMTSIFPVLLGALIKKASTVSGASEVSDLLNGNEGNIIFDLLPGLLNDREKSANLLPAGAKLLPFFLGNQHEKLVESVSESSGVNKFSSASLLGLAAPILIGVMRKHMKASNMKLSDLTGWLMEQKDSVLATIPGSLGNTFQSSDLVDHKGKISQDTDREAGALVGLGKWVFWLIGAIFLVGLLWQLKTAKKEDSLAGGAATTLNSVTPAVETIVDSVVVGTKGGLGMLGDFFKMNLPNGIELNIPKFGIENYLISFIQDKNTPVDKTTWFNFDRIMFETGSAKLSPESLEQTKNIAEILKAFPAVKLKIGGYTDNTGDPAVNLKLSQDRANTVKAAIVSEGIEAGRMDAEGYGKEFPVASNADEAGRAQNRRIALRVTAK